MSNKFVSGGIIGPGGETTNEEAPNSSEQQPRQAGANAAEWEVVQKQLEAERRQREEQRVKAATGDEKSLYDILQENKAAKQAAFEEQNKIRNQFRALDDDEVDFLDEVRAKKRKEEELVRRETEEGLRAFRDRQKGGGAVGGEGAGEGEVKGGVETEDWGGAGARKRKRAKDREVKGAVVKRRVSEGEKVEDMDSETKKNKKQEEAVADEKKKTEAATQTKPALGLADYGSDDSD